MVGAPGLGHGGRAARRGPGDGDRPGGRPAGRADGAVARRPGRRWCAGRRRGYPRHRPARAGGERSRRRLPRHAPRARPPTARRDGAAAVRARGRARGRRRRSRASGTRCWWSRLPAAALVDGDPPASALVVEVKRDAPRSEAEAELPAPLAEPRLDFRVDRASALSLRGARGRVHPGDRRARAPVLGLPRLPHAEARERSRARHGRRDHADADGRRLSAARALRQVLRRGHGPARAGGAGHGRPPRHVRARVHAPATTRTWATPAT